MIVEMIISAVSHLKEHFEQTNATFREKNAFFY